MKTIASIAPTGMTGSTAEQRFEAATYRAVTLRIVPLLALCYVFSIVDRLNIGIAKLQMMPSLGFSDAVYGFGAGVFFLGYLLFDVPSNLMLHRCGARRWLARIMITWGLLSTCMAFVSTSWMFYLLRFAVGAAEAGFFAGIVLYTTYWFPAPRRARIFAMLLFAMPVSAVISGGASGWLMSFSDRLFGLAGWQWVFVVEGLPSVLLGLLTWRFLDDGIAQARWLSAAQKSLLINNLGATVATRPADATVSGALSSGRVWLLCAICFAISAGMYGVGFWLPTLIATSGVVGIRSIGWLSALPWIVAVVPLWLVGRSSDARGERRWHVAIPLAVCGLGLLGSVWFSHPAAMAVLCLTFASCGVLTSLALFWSLPTAFLSGYGAAAGIALINSIGSIAGFVFPFVIGVIKVRTGSLDYGIVLLAAVILVGACLPLTLRKSVVDR